MVECDLESTGILKETGLSVSFLGVPGMAYILLVKVQSQVSTTKCSEPQVEIGNDGMKEVV